MLFDTHAHMDDRAFDGDRALLLDSLPGQGIGLLMNPGCSLASSRAACALSREYDYIYAAVGSHPDAADEVDDSVLEEYRLLCRGKLRKRYSTGAAYHHIRCRHAQRHIVYIFHKLKICRLVKPRFLKLTARFLISACSAGVSAVYIGVL